MRGSILMKVMGVAVLAHMACIPSSENDAGTPSADAGPDTAP